MIGDLEFLRIILTTYVFTFFNDFQTSGPPRYDNSIVEIMCVKTPVLLSYRLRSWFIPFTRVISLKPKMFYYDVDKRVDFLKVY